MFYSRCDSPAARGRRGCVLSLEALEGRAVPAVVVAPGTVSFREGETRQVSFKLNKPPTADVTFTLQSSNTAEATIDKPALTFTVTNWQTPQVVTISAIEDLMPDGNKSLKIVTGVSTSTDPKYSNKSVPDVTVKTIDSKRVNPELWRGSYAGTFTGKGVHGTIRASISGRVITVEIRINVPSAGIVDMPAYGTGAIADDGSFSVLSEGGVFDATYRGKMVLKGLSASAAGNWVYPSVTSGSWRISRTALSPSPIGPPVTG